MNIFLDIETLPSLAHDAREQSRQCVKPPGNIKKPESIAAWWETEGDAAIEETHRKQALDGAHGELCAVGFATDESDPVSLVRGLGEPESDFIRRALTSIDEMINQNIYHTPFFICHNAQFDLGFLLRRCWANNIKPPFAIPGPSAREGKDFGDTMTMWAGYRGTIGLDRLCSALGVPSPKVDGMDGSKVFDTWKIGCHETIAHYNIGDVQATRACWKRLNWLNTESEDASMKREEDDKLQAAEQVEQIKAQFAAKAATPAIVEQPDNGATMKLGEISARLGFAVTADFLAQIGFRPHATDKNAKLYRECDFPRICNALIDHINAAMRDVRKVA